MITRCTQDIAGVDTQFTLSLRTLVAIFLYVAIRLCAPIYFTPIFLLPSIFIGGVGACIANVYLKAQMSVKREQRCLSSSIYHVVCSFYHSNARSPLLAHLGAAITGLGSFNTSLFTDNSDHLFSFGPSLRFPGCFQGGVVKTNRSLQQDFKDNFRSQSMDRHSHRPSWRLIHCSFGFVSCCHSQTECRQYWIFVEYIVRSRLDNAVHSSYIQ